MTRFIIKCCLAILLMVLMMFTFPYIKVKSDIPALLCIADVVVLIVLVTMKNEQTKSF